MHKTEQIMDSKSTCPVKKDGTPDLRYKVNKTDQAPPSPCRAPLDTCLICTDTMEGKVTLKCGHEMCPTCFAKHARANHTCPFCRDEFAPAVKPKVSMPIEVAESMVTMDTLSNAHRWADVMRAMQNADDDDKRVSLLLSSVGTAQMRLLGLAKHWYECDCSH